MPATDTDKRIARAMKGVDVGDTVHYVWPDSGHHHAAFVANILDADRGYVTLSVLDHNGGFMQSPWTQYDADGAPGTWHPAEAADDADPLDPAGLNIDHDGRTGVPQGAQAEVVGMRPDADPDDPAAVRERVAGARPPRIVAKDDPLGERIRATAEATGTETSVGRFGGDHPDLGDESDEDKARSRRAGANDPAPRTREPAQGTDKPDEAPARSIPRTDKPDEKPRTLPERTDKPDQKPAEKKD
jgi:hypothetical protein